MTPPRTSPKSPLLAGFFLAFALLLGCGGGGNTAACELPAEIVVTRGWAGDVHQYRKVHADAPYVMHASGAAAFTAVLPCPGSGTQWLHFKTWGEGFFEPAHGLPGRGGHLAALTRGTFDLSVPRYQARGVILHTDWGVLGERFHRNDVIGATNVLQCPAWLGGGTCPPDVVVPPHQLVATDAVVHWQIESTPGRTAYNLYSTAAAANAASTWAEGYDFMTLNGTDIGLAVLCKVDCAGPFIARFFDISAGWK